MSAMQRSIRPSAKGSTSQLGNLSKTYDGKIAGLYDLEETLGRGHFAVVKLARHVFTGEKVAVKVIDKNKLDEVSKAHLFQEVRCMKLVQHPNVVRLYDVIDTATKLYLILELGDGGDLYEYIMKHDTGLPEHIAKEYFSQIVRAISYCHQLHVVHRDLKPENVVFFKKQGVVKLTDFGFSNKFYPGQKLETSCGSLAYSAPEILLGDSYDAPAVDVWSLGVILFMLVCGQAPFQEANDSETLTMIMDCKYEIPMHVSQNCRKLISRMLLRSPEKRATLAEISEHPWLSSNKQNNADALPLVSKEQLSEEDHNFIVQKIANGKIATKEEIQESLEKNEYNHVTATYFLLAERKLRSKRQIQADKNKRPEDLAVRQKDHSEDTNVAIKPSLLNVPRTPGDLPQRSRKCSIVQEDEEEEDMSSCSGREDLGPPLNRRGSRSEGRLNLTIQERIAESEKRKPVERKHVTSAKKTAKSPKQQPGVVKRPDLPPILVIATDAEDAQAPQCRGVVSEHRKARFHKSRTASCSSSDASDDDSEKRKKRAQKLTTPSKSFEVRRDSHDDSSDSQETGTGAAPGRGPAPVPSGAGAAPPTEGRGSGERRRGGGEVGGKKAGQTRLRESRSLNRITEVQEEAALGVAASATVGSIQSVGARILHGLGRAARRGGAEEGPRASRRDSLGAARDSVRLLADKMEACNKLQKTVPRSQVEKKNSNEDLLKLARSSISQMASNNHPKSCTNVCCTTRTAMTWPENEHPNSTTAPPSANSNRSVFGRSPPKPKIAPEKPLPPLPTVPEMQPGEIPALPERYLAAAASAEPESEIDSDEEVQPGPSDEVANENEKILDKQMVFRLMEMFPNACPQYIRQICGGKTWPEFDEIVTVILSDENHPKRVKKPPSPPRQMTIEDQLELVKALLPDADPTYLRYQVEAFRGDPVLLNEFIFQANETKTYPTMKEYLRKQKFTAQSKQYTSEFNVENFVQLFPEPRKTFADPTRTVNIDDYTSLYITTYFQNKFNTLSVKTVRSVLNEKGFRIVPSNDLLLQHLSANRTLKIKRKHLPTLDDIPQNIAVLQELAYLTHQTEIETYIKEKKEKEERDRRHAKENNLMNTCRCCFDEEVMPKDTFSCPNGCTFCRDCIKRSCEVAMGQGRTVYECLEGCDAEFTLQTLQNVLPPKMFSKLAQKKTVAEAQAAGIDELESCPFCEFASIPNEDDKIFHCLNEDCMKESCRLCHQENHIPYKCDEVDEDADVKARTYVENKMTEALLRKCWKCGMSFFKEEGCNKMTCTCGAKMCYICKSPVEDYSHFNGIGGDKFDLCPLYSDSNAVNKENVLGAAQAAKAEIDPSRLKVDPSADIDKHFEERKKVLPREPHLEFIELDMLNLRLRDDGPQGQPQGLPRRLGYRHQQEDAQHDVLMVAPVALMAMVRENPQYLQELGRLRNARLVQAEIAAPPLPPPRMGNENVLRLAQGAIPRRRHIMRDYLEQAEAQDQAQAQARARALAQAQAQVQALARARAQAQVQTQAQDQDQDQDQAQAQAQAQAQDQAQVQRNDAVEREPTDMADDDDWFGGGDDDAPPEVKPLGKKAEEPPPAAEGAPPPAAPAEGPEAEAAAEAQEEALEDEYLDPDKLLLFKHWIRPKFLPYKYLYMYRRNYYDDVMDYLDKRSRGIYREIPRAETWPERIMRTYSNKLNKYAMFTKRIQEDLAFTEMTKSSGNFFYYHAKNVFDRQFSPLLH